MMLESILDGAILVEVNMSAYLPKAVRVRGKPGVEIPAGAALRGTFASKHPAIVKFASARRVLSLQRTRALQYCPAQGKV